MDTASSCSPVFDHARKLDSCGASILRPSVPGDQGRSTSCSANPVFAGTIVRDAALDRNPPDKSETITDWGFSVREPSIEHCKALLVNAHDLVSTSFETQADMRISCQIARQSMHDAFCM